jgi:glycosyltransferase involved in cell wall biosynthesis
MNICVITSLNFPPEEGIGNYIYNMSQQFIRKGHKVTVLTRGGIHKTQIEDFEGIELCRVPFIPLYPFHVHIHGIFIKSILRSISDEFDVIHYHTPLSPPIDFGLPIVTTVHTPMKTDTSKVELVNPLSVAVKLQGKISYLLEKQLFSISNIVTSVATSVAEELTEYGLKKEDIVVVGNGVDETIFYPVETRNKEKYVLYTGRLSYRKGLFDFIYAGVILSEKYPDIKFKLTGKGPLLEQLQSKVKEAGHEDKFEFLGHVTKDELINLYQNATVFVLPSHYEGLPTTLLEAMACGAPVVATAVSGNLDVIEDGKNGLLVPIKSPSLMADAVSNLLDDDLLRVDLGKAARKTIEDKFTWDAISDKIMACYLSVLQEGSTPK